MTRGAVDGSSRTRSSSLPARSVRILDESTRAELAATDGAGPFGPEGRPMGGYVSAPTAWADEPERIAEWVARAFEQVATLPPKAPKPPKPRAVRK